MDKIKRLRELLDGFKPFENSEEWNKEVSKLLNVEDIHDICSDGYYYGDVISMYIKGYEDALSNIKRTKEE